LDKPGHYIVTEQKDQKHQDTSRNDEFPVRRVSWHEWIVIDMYEIRIYMLKGFLIAPGETYA